MGLKKKMLYTLLGLVVIAAGVYVYEVHFHYRLTEVAKDKVYSSSLMPTEKLEKYVEKNKIKTVIDLRVGDVFDPLNPSTSSEITKEKEAIESLGNVNYVNIPSQQIPSEENLEEFYKVLDNEDAYPVLIHCYHGTGRAVLYSALYKVEYEGISPEEARKTARFPTLLSNFDNGTPKGEWLKNYKERKSKKAVTATETNE